MNSDDKIISRCEIMFVILRSEATKNLDGIRFFATLRMT